MVEEAQATGELADVFDKAGANKSATGRIDNILAVHSLHPRTLIDHFNLYKTIMHRPPSSATGLTRCEREVLAVVVSTLNECHY